MKLDIGCGINKQAGFIGVDALKLEGVDVVYDVRQTPWPWDENTVEEVHSSHFLEHLTSDERVKFFNELYRVMKVGAQARIITPGWSHSCAYGDPTHQWPPVSEWAVFYLNRSWRLVNAPHTDRETRGDGWGYTCDFDFVTAGSIDPWLSVRNQETVMFAMQRYVNSTRDLIMTLTKRGPS